MSESSLQKVTQHVAALVAENVPIPHHQIDVALSGHAALLNLVQEMHHSLSRYATYPKTAVRPLDIERRPVAALGQLLYEHPHSVTRPLTDVLSEVSVGAWRELSRQATLALHDWSAQRSTFATAVSTWSGMADVAALSQAITVLDGDLAQALNRAGRLMEAATFRAASRSGLRLAADETLRVARSGRLLDSTTNYPHRRAILTIPVPAALPVALDRLVFLIDKADLTPTQVDRIGVTLTRTALSAADSLKVAGHRHLALRLDSLADQLSRVPTMAARLKSLNDGDLLAYLQAGRIDVMLATMAEGRTPLPVPAATTVAHALRSGVPSLASTAQEQLASGSWVIPDDSSEAVAWRRASSDDLLPKAVQQLAEAAETARSLPAGKALPEAQSPTPVQRLITQALQDRRSSVRPTWPGREPRSRKR